MGGCHSYRSSRPGRIVLLLMGAVGLCGLSRAWAADDDDDARKVIRAERLDEMRRRVQAISLSRAEADGTMRPLPLIDRPLLRFDDPARGFHDGTLWGWGTAGRPVALVTVERYEKLWAYELISLADESSGGMLTAVTASGWKWSPREPGIHWQAFDDAPAPAETEAGRLNQMKGLARRLAVTMILWNGERFALRLQPRPVHRYAAPADRVRDGAIFTCAYGINPEALVLIECRDAADGRPGWVFALAPLTSGGVTAELDGRTVWDKPRSMKVHLQEPYATETEPILPPPKK